MSNDPSCCPIHPEHKLRPMEPRDPFYCNKCKEIGFGTGYGCPQNVARFHEECVSPSPAVSQRLQWKKKKELSMTYDPHMKAENGKPRICAVCARPVRGCGYRSSSGMNCHPSCLALPKSIMVNDVELKLAYEKKADCKWCGKMKIYDEKKVKLLSWSYATKRKAEYHVGCVKEMAIESWRNGKFIPAKEGDGGGPMHIKVDLPSMGTSARSAMKIFLGVAMLTASGDVTSLVN